MKEEEEEEDNNDIPFNAAAFIANSSNRFNNGAPARTSATTHARL